MFVCFSHERKRSGVDDTICVAYQVQAPAMSVPTNAQFWSKEDPSKPDAAFLKNHFYREGRLTEEQAMFILEKGTELLRAESNVLEVDAPITGASHDYHSRRGEMLTPSFKQSVETFMDNMLVLAFVLGTNLS